MVICPHFMVSRSRVFSMVCVGIVVDVLYNPFMQHKADETGAVLGFNIIAFHPDCILT